MPKTLWLGLAIIGIGELLLFTDVVLRGGVILGHDNVVELTLPNSWLGRVAREGAVNVTVFCWLGYIIFLDGLLTMLARQRNRPELSSIRQRPNRFITTTLLSVVIWCWFDTINFYFMDAWRYLGLPDAWWQRYAGYLIAFGAILPGMFMTAQVFLALGVDRLRGPALRLNRLLEVMLVFVGAGCVALPFFIPDPIANLALWVSLFLLLDPINRWMGEPSVLSDWDVGRWGRTVALFAGGMTCGFLWEWWNYWAAAKWVYHLPFLGPLENYRYFEMPLLGLLGFPAFAVECWVVLNTLLALLRRARMKITEALPNDSAVM